MKYLFLDFGNVICYPTTGNWFITPYLDQYIKRKRFSKKKIIESVSNFSDILNRKYDSMEDEVIMYHDLYKSIFELLNYKVSEEDINYIANDITYSTNKYTTFKEIGSELKELKKKYKLILLTDNWPCGEYLMHIWSLSDYFEKMYISSYYGIRKDNPDFFKLPMKEFNIKSEDIIFIDDNDAPLNTATSLGITSYKMDRFNKIKKDKYPVIHNLFEIK